MSHKYYLASMESRAFAEARECLFVKSMRFSPTGKRCVLARIAPSVPGYHFGWVDEISDVVLSCRHQGEDIDPISELPLFVHIAVPVVVGLEDRDVIDPDALRKIAWGELYATRHEAENHIVPKDRW